MLALSVACARCHDHKFDPIPTADYYAMAGIFRSTDVLGGVKRGNNKTGYAGDYVHLDQRRPSEAASELTDERKRLAELNTELAEARRQELQAVRNEARRES